MDTALEILKYLSLLVTTALTVIGLVTESRKRTGGVSKWGQRSLVGIGITTILAFSIQILESHLARNAAETQLEMSNRILASLYTTIHNSEQSLAAVNVSLDQGRATIDAIERDLEASGMLLHQMERSLSALDEVSVSLHYLLRPVGPPDPAWTNFVQPFARASSEAAALGCIEFEKRAQQLRGALSMKLQCADVPGQGILLNTSLGAPEVRVLAASNPKMLGYVTPSRFVTIQFYKTPVDLRSNCMVPVPGNQATYTYPDGYIEPDLEITFLVEARARVFFSAKQELRLVVEGVVADKREWRFGGSLGIAAAGDLNSGIQVSVAERPTTGRELNIQRALSLVQLEFSPYGSFRLPLTSYECSDGELHYSAQL